MHIPGSYVHFQSTSQVNSITPDFVDSNGGPIELSGSQRCGSFTHEAKEKGCIFDIMSYGFTAPECYYHDLAKDAQSNGPWRWYLNKNGNFGIPQDSNLLSRSVEVWTELDYHVLRCKYAQRLLQLAMEDDNFLLPQEVARTGRTTQCETMIANYSNHTQTMPATWIRMLYNPCARLSEIDQRTIV